MKPQHLNFSEITFHLIHPQKPDFKIDIDHAIVGPDGYFFKTEISKVDAPLLRRGRLIAKYEFKELEVEKANALSIKLGYNANLTAPITLSAIYNQDEKEFQPTDRNSIGFKSVGLN